MNGKKSLKSLTSSKEPLISSKKFLYKYEDLSLYRKALDGYIRKSRREEELAKLTNAGAYQRERYSNKSPSGALIEEYLHFPKNNQNLQELENDYIVKPMNSPDYQAVTAIKTLIEYFEDKQREIQILKLKQGGEDGEDGEEIEEKKRILKAQINSVKELAQESKIYRKSTINEIASGHIEDKSGLSEILNIIGHLKAGDLNGENKGSTDESKELFSTFLTVIDSYGNDILGSDNFGRDGLDSINQLEKIRLSYLKKTVDIDTAEDYSKTIRAVRSGEFEQEIEEEYNKILENRKIKEEDLLKMTPETFRDFSLEAMNRIIIKKTFLETLHEEEWYKELLEEVKKFVEENSIDEDKINDFTERIDSEIITQLEERINLHIQATGEVSTFPLNIPGVKWAAEKIGKKEFPINKELLDIQESGFNINFQGAFNDCINKEKIAISPELQNSFKLVQNKFKRKFSPPSINLISSKMANTVYTSRKIPVKKVNVLRHRDEGISHNILTQNPRNVSGIASLKNEIDSRRKQTRLTKARLATFQKDKKKNYFEIKKKIDELEREEFVLAEAERRLYNLESKLLLEIKTRNFSNLKEASEDEIISPDSNGSTISNRPTFTIAYTGK